MSEPDRLKCIQAVIDGDLKPGKAAERLELTVRQIERLVIRYRNEGPVGLVSRHRNRPGNRSLKAPLVEHVVKILRAQYPDFGLQQPRPRRACLGELIQIDGCEHRWFEERAPMCTVLVYVDDATSRLMQILFTGSESTFA